MASYSAEHVLQLLENEDILGVPMQDGSEDELEFDVDEDR